MEVDLGFGEASESRGQLTVDVAAGDWPAALAFARDELDCDFFDFLSAVDELAEGIRLVAHVYSTRTHDHLLIRTLLPPDDLTVASAVPVYPGANWHERETHEMFGVRFEGHPNLVPLLLPDGFEGHPLRKDFVLASRVAKQWPGEVNPGESLGELKPRRRRNLPPGVPGDWGPGR